MHSSREFGVVSLKAILIGLIFNSNRKVPQKQPWISCIFAGHLAHLSITNLPATFGAIPIQDCAVSQVNGFMKGIKTEDSLAVRVLRWIFKNTKNLPRKTFQERLERAIAKFPNQNKPLIQILEQITPSPHLGKQLS